MRMQALHVIVLSICLAQVALAESVYRWVDDKGQVHYGNQLPPKTTKFKAVQPAPKADKTSVVAATASAAPTASTPTASYADMAQLEQKLQSAYAELEAATQAYNRAKAVRLANERNYTTYLARIRPLEEKVQMAEIRVQQLQMQMQDLAEKNKN